MYGWVWRPETLVIPMYLLLSSLWWSCPKKIPEVVQTCRYITDTSTPLPLCSKETSILILHRKRCSWKSCPNLYPQNDEILQEPTSKKCHYQCRAKLLDGPNTAFGPCWVYHSPERTEPIFSFQELNAIQPYIVIYHLWSIPYAFK